MYVDDDVLLGPGCIARLVEGLERKPGFAALGADSAAEMRGGWDHWDYPRHVGMAATLFRRERLLGVTFRWEGERCECRCCCDDLRRAGFGIGYHSAARAWHRPIANVRGRTPAEQRLERSSSAGVDRSTTSTNCARILTAFDRNHFDRFRRQFVPTLRASGNHERLTAVAYGLYPSDAVCLKSRGSRSCHSPITACRPRCGGCMTFRMLSPAGRKIRRSRTGMPAM